MLKKSLLVATITLMASFAWTQSSWAHMRHKHGAHPMHHDHAMHQEHPAATAPQAQQPATAKHVKYAKHKDAEKMAPTKSN